MTGSGAPLESGSSLPGSPPQNGASNIDDFDLPRTVINRIAKTCFPDGTALGKETRLALTKSATVFIHYITATASDLCRGQNKKTLSVDHIYKALEVNEFEGILDYVKEMVASVSSAVTLVRLVQTG